MRIALVYDRVNKWGGAERLLLALHRVFPEAPLMTALYEPKTTGWIGDWAVFPSVLNRLSFLRTRHQQIPFLMPFAFESINFNGFDVVISVTSAEAKGIITRPETMHVCYCLTPTRYLYSHREEYLRSARYPKITGRICKILQKWDRVAAGRPDYYLAISETVRQRINAYYHREADVIYPPVGGVKESLKVSKFKSLTEGVKEPFFLVVSRLEPYKKVELVIDACNRIGQNLVIAGTGSQEKKLRSLAGPTVFWAGELTDEELFGYYKACRALIMPQIEDFGLVSLEAQSCGRPVLAWRKGGATETVIENKTGLFFDSQTSGALIDGIHRMSQFRPKASDMIRNVARFSADSFKNQMTGWVEEKWQHYQKTRLKS